MRDRLASWLRTFHDACTCILRLWVYDWRVGDLRLGRHSGAALPAVTRGFIHSGSTALAVDELAKFRLTSDALEGQVAVEGFALLVGTRCLPAAVDGLSAVRHV